MEYTFTRTLHGPAVVGDDELVFFQEFGPLQDYINGDPQFFEKAYAFCKEVIAEYGAALADSITENVVGLDRAVGIMNYWHAVQALKRFEWDMKQHNHMVPGSNPQF